MMSPNERLIQEITKMAQNPWDHYSEKIEELLRSNVYTLDYVSKTRKDIFRFPGVYLITCQDDSEIVWVGKTVLSLATADKSTKRRYNVFQSAPDSNNQGSPPKPYYMELFWHHSLAFSTIIPSSSLSADRLSR